MTKLIRETWLLPNMKNSFNASRMALWSTRNRRISRAAVAAATAWHFCPVVKCTWFWSGPTRQKSGRSCATNPSGQPQNPRPSSSPAGSSLRCQPTAPAVSFPKWGKRARHFEFERPITFGNRLRERLFEKPGMIWELDTSFVNLPRCTLDNLS